MKHFLALDLGGSYLKAVLYSQEQLAEAATPHILRLPSQLAGAAGPDNMLSAIRTAFAQLDCRNREVAAIGISTAGIVDYAGKRLARTADHLAALRDPQWRETLEWEFRLPVVLINDADAALIGAVHCNLTEPDGNNALLAIGTGLGCAVLKKGHRCRPGRELTLLGSIRTPAGSFDQLASATRLAALASDGNPAELFRLRPPALDDYLDTLAGIVTTAAILYQLDTVILAGGLTAAAAEVDFNLAAALQSRLDPPAPELRQPVRLKVAPQGNSLQLLGAGLLAAGAAQLPDAALPPAGEMATEQPLFANLELGDLAEEELCTLLFEAETGADAELRSTLPAMAQAVRQVTARWRDGGRLIYLGAGTSGRLAALDAVELPCTYGVPESRVAALIAGGNDDAALTIESDGEEDASSIPELLLLKLTPQDVVIGISASGSAFYVRSGLAYARSCGCYTVMIQESPSPRLACDAVLALRSGAELVAGSTRMKAGTATKKLLNFLSTAVIIRLGKTRCSRMCNLQTLNEKLRRRAAAMPPA
ncbi:N-acetylmuramic acid 6-phosphate etherase [Victivallis sp. Marseille-Q1083]|uniref:N-acetylmuramic acid 6-phosphate etherase n=1 Tax=Victivallis sp. Marseille-Q1083 TaxID=2717288 RepID=UPI00158A32F4|nr:N-acetylmuramic acid 6-phosphate etherase [Victivallis sp. Marseille-Q1083]